MSRTDPPAEVMSVADVMARYGLRDRRAARRLMDEAGAFLIAGRLVIRREDLTAHEDRLRRARRIECSPALLVPCLAPRHRSAARPRRSRKEPLRPGWWRDYGASEAA